MVSLTGKNERKTQMNTNLKTLALALVAGFALIACADESACAPEVNDSVPAEETAMAPAAETPVATAASESAPAEKKAKRRGTRCAKKDKSAAPANKKQKTPRRRRARKMESAEIPVTGILDSAE